MLGPAVAALGEALDPPAADLLALARRLAATIDAMPPAVAVPMLPNHAGPLVKVLTELDARYRRRSAGRERGRRRMAWSGSGRPVLQAMVARRQQAPTGGRAA